MAQSPLILVPPARQSGLILTPIADAPSGILDFTQIKEMDNAAVSDPGGVLSSSSFTGGLFTVVFSAATTQVDGLRENVATWELGLEAWLADQGITFDPARHIIMVMVDFRGGGRGGQFAHPGAANGAGFFAGLQDRAGRSNTNGIAAGQYASGASGTTAALLGNTLSNTNGLSFHPEAIMLLVSFEESGTGTWTPLPLVRYRSSVSGVWGDEEHMQAAVPAAFQADPTNWKLVVGASKHNTNSATGADIRARIFVGVALKPSTEMPD